MTVNRKRELIPTLFLAAACFLAFSSAVEAQTATRFLPDTYTPTQAVSVSIQVNPAAGTQAWAVEETPPNGWTVSDINEDGGWDSVNKEVKWGLFFGASAKTLTYKATPPTGESGIKTFSGLASFDGTSVDIGGESSIGQQGEETISKPGTPTGELSPCLNQSYTYTTSGATSSFGHTVEYQFDWGDGSTSSWSTSKSASHSWSTTSQKTVTVAERCQTHTSISNTSDELTITVQDCGPQPVVPNVVGMQRTAAESVIMNAGLIVGTVTEQISTEPVGQVLSQNPVGGSLVSPGTAINLTVSKANSQPNVPTLIQPPNGATEVSLTPTLVASEFLDPDLGDTHSKSRWQIATDSEFSSVVLDSFPDAKNLTSYPVPSGILQNGMLFYWRVCYADNHNVWSDWPAPFHFTTIPCEVPSIPTGVSASDGTYTDRVRVTWDAVSGTGIEYRVYRDGYAIGNWQTSTLYDDYNVQAASVSSTGGCPPGQQVNYVYHNYQVKARNACGESGLSSANSGYRGYGKSMFSELTISEKVLPFTEAAQNSELALRLMSDEPIDANTVWAVAEREGLYEEGGVWRPSDLNDNRDGWVLFAPVTTWPSGGTVTMTVGAFTVSGVEVGPVTHEFVIAIENGEALSPTGPGIRPLESDEVPTDSLSDGISPVYRVEPAGVFDEPVTVWIPAPNDADLNNLEIYYYSESDEHLGWHRGGNVTGWMTPDGLAVVEENGEIFIELEINHSGIVQLAAKRRFSELGNIGLMLGLVGILGACSFSRRRKR